MTAIALGARPVHAGLATSKALYKEHVEDVDEPVLKKSSSNIATKVRHNMEHLCKSPEQC